MPDGIRIQRLFEPPLRWQALAFSGIHVISSQLLPMISEKGIFSIIATYLRLAGQGESISAFRADNYYWRDLGKPENVLQASRDVEQNEIRLDLKRKPRVTRRIIPRLSPCGAGLPSIPSLYR